MIKVEITENPPIETWDNLVGSLPEGTIFQTTYWGNYINEKGYKPYYLIAYDNSGKVIGLLLFYGLRSVTQENMNPLKNYAHSLFRSITWNYGPLILDKTLSKKILAAFTKVLDSFCETNNILRIRHAVPPIHNIQIFDNNIWTGMEGFKQKPWATYLIDLAQPEEALWKNIKREARKSIKKGRDSGLRVSTIKDKMELSEYLDLLIQMRNKLNLDLPPFYPDETMWKFFNEKQLIKVFVTSYLDELCGGLAIICFNGILFEIAAARDISNSLCKYAGDMIKWAIIKWGCENGQKTYDLSGVSPNPATSKETAIKRFKKKYGGQYIEFPRVDKVYSIKRYKLFKFIRKLIK